MDSDDTLLVAIALAISMIVGIVTIVVNSIRNYRQRKEREKERERAKAAPVPKPRRWDPALCPHAWKRHDSGSCKNANSDCSGEPNKHKWEVWRCEHCETKKFRCSNTSCPSLDECRRQRTADSPSPGEIQRELVDKIADVNGFEYERYRLTDQFGNKRVAYLRINKSGEKMSFKEPEGMQEVCPCGGKHTWELVDSWSQEELPEGVDGCLENLCLVEEVWYEKWRCSKCGKERVN